MAEISAVGHLIAELKASTGLSWAALSDAIGASSGDYIRKVAAGVRPGKNLEGNVRELLTRGEVSRAVPRRRDRAGNIRPVRAKTGTSRRPGENVLRQTPEGRRIFRGEKGLGYTVSTGEFPTPGEANFRKAITSAAKGHRRGVPRRLSFVVSVREGITGVEYNYPLGTKGGYTPQQVREGVKQAGSVEEWLYQGIENIPGKSVNPITEFDNPIITDCQIKVA